MKFQCLWLFFLLLSLPACGSNCKHQVTITATSRKEIGTLTPLPTSTTIPTAKITSYLPVTLTHTSTATQTELPTPQPTSTPAPTMIPTLAQGDAYARFLVLMQTNDGCKLPCWWGITPGTSSLSEIQAKLIPFSGISIYNSFPAYTGGNIGIYYPVDNLNFFLGVDYSLLSDKKTIKSIQVIANMDRTNGEGYLEEVRGSDSYNEIVSAYTLFGILSTFGPPPSVLIRAENRGEGKTTAYEPMDIVLVYPEQGLSIQYDMISERTADTFIGCPSTAFLNMWLVSPGDQDVLLLGNIPNAKPLEEATQMTVDEFYQAFKEPTDICVQTPVDIWPHP